MNQVDYELDICGESCPYPVIHTLEGLDGIKPGEVMAIITDCPQAFRNIPDDATASGHHVLDSHREGARMTFIIRRGEKTLATPLQAAKKELKQGAKEDAKQCDNAAGQKGLFGKLFSR